MTTTEQDLKDITPGSPVRFAYTYTADGATVLVTGTARGLTSKGGFAVELDHGTAGRLHKRDHIKAAIRKDIRHPVAAFAPARMTPDPALGTVAVPVQLPPAADAMTLAFQVTGDPAAADGRYGTPGADGWHTLTRWDVSPDERSYLLRYSIWGRADHEATARAFADEQFRLPVPQTGRWRVTGTYRGGSVVIGGTFGTAR